MTNAMKQYQKQAKKQARKSSAKKVVTKRNAVIVASVAGAAVVGTGVVLATRNPAVAAKASSMTAAVLSKTRPVTTALTSEAAKTGVNTFLAHSAKGYLLTSAAYGAGNTLGMVLVRRWVSGEKSTTREVLGFFGQGAVVGAKDPLNIALSVSMGAASVNPIAGLVAFSGVGTYLVGAAAWRMYQRQILGAALAAKVRLNAVSVDRKEAAYIKAQTKADARYDALEQVREQEAITNEALFLMFVAPSLGKVDISKATEQTLSFSALTSEEVTDVAEAFVKDAAVAKGDIPAHVKNLRDSIEGLSGLPVNKVPNASLFIDEVIRLANAERLTAHVKQAA